MRKLRHKRFMTPHNICVFAADCKLVPAQIGNITQKDGIYTLFLWATDEEWVEICKNDFESI